MPRTERRTEILETVIRIAEREGFAAATIRRVAGELKISPGNLHHLFSSTSELKREAFQQFILREKAKMEDQPVELAPIDEVMSYLLMTAMDGDFSVRKLWSSAVEESRNDPEFAKLYAASAQHVLGRITELLGIITEGRMDPISADDTSWRLMTFAIGISVSGASSIWSEDDRIAMHLRKILAFELAQYA